MLSSIKKGKRKRKSGDLSSDNNANSRKQKSNEINTSTAGHDSNTNSNKNSSYEKDNREAAEELRRMLSGIKKSDHNAIQDNKSASTDYSSERKQVKTDSLIERFEKRKGMLASTLTDNRQGENDKNETETSLLVSSKYAAGSQSILRKEDFRQGARKGKLKQTESYLHSGVDKTIAEMVQDEKQSKQEGAMDMDETFARNVARMGSRYKGNEFKMVAGSTAGADEDDLAGDGGIDMKMFTSASDRLTDTASYNREVSRQVAHLRKENAITNKCSWWMESGSFRKHMLLSLGDHVSLVLVPSHSQLVKSQCYLVPIKHAEAFVSCEDEVWDEVGRFKSSLGAMFRKEGKGVLFCETVLPSKSLWQTRMDVVPVPLNVEQDAQIFFKSALNEVAEEWGTHTKLISTKGKNIRQTVPKGFSYFNIEWDTGGFAQIIETQSFPKDFGLDTIAGKSFFTEH